MKEESAKNIAVPSEIQNPAVVPAIIKTGTMARKTKAAQNTLPYLMITDFLLTVTGISFKKIYSLRTEAEQYNARFKQTGQERLWVHSENAAKNLNTIAHITLLAVAYAAFITNSNHSVRCLKSAKRIA